MNKLFVYFERERVGELIFNEKSDDLEFCYDQNWKQNGFEISPAFSFRSEKIPPREVKRFLENLFPEGSGLDELKEHFRISGSNSFAILKIIGKDTAGALSFLSLDAPLEDESSFREVTKEELLHRLDERSKKGLAIWDGKMRLSVAGVQDKLPVVILQNGRVGFGDGQLASTHIYKFQKNDKRIPHLVLNEFFCMKLAKEIGLDVPEVSFLRLGTHPILIVKRFDRQLLSDQKVVRRHMIDGCQSLNLLPSYRYERNFGSEESVAGIREGASFEKLFKFIFLCDSPAKNNLLLLRWMLFNLLIGNSDAHGKNLSFFVDKKGIRMTPFYDLVSVTMYSDLDHELAMSIGDEFNPSQIFAFQLAEFCDQCGIQKKLLANQLKDMCKKVEMVIENIALPPCEKEEGIFLEDLKKSVIARLSHYTSLIPEIPKKW